MSDPQSEFVERYGGNDREPPLLCPAGFPVPPGTKEWAVLRGDRGPKGDKGEPGKQGKQGARGEGMQLRSRRAVAVLIVVLFVLEALNLLFTAAYENHTQAAQRRAGLAVERSICQTLGQLAALKPPPGDPATNPSRAFDDRLHATLDGLGPDLGCR